MSCNLTKVAASGGAGSQEKERKSAGVTREKAMLDLLEQQKKLTVNQWKIAGAATLGDMLDFFDFFLIGFVLAFIV